MGAVPPMISPSDTATTALTAEIRALKLERGAAILAHNYQRPEIQDLADVVADSLKMARRATELDAKVLVICGVHFMAETAAIANPDKRVLIPDLNAGCSLAATIQAADVRAWRTAHPDGVVVAYVNTAADVKAEADYCCTSGNAVAVIRALRPTSPSSFSLTCFSAITCAKSPAGSSTSGWVSVTCTPGSRARCWSNAASSIPTQSFWCIRSAAA